MTSPVLLSGDIQENTRAQGRACMRLVSKPQSRDLGIFPPPCGPIPLGSVFL